MQTKILKNKPLVEAILEIRWELSTLPNGAVRDEQYDMIVGQLRQTFINELPFHARLPFGFMPGVTLPYQVQHQFRAGPDKWPLVQIGPGILTINETEGYTSESFIPFCHNVFQSLLGFWAKNENQPNLLYVALRYIDADLLSEPRLEFLKKLGININFEKDIFNPKVFGKLSPKHVELNTALNVADPAGTFILAISTGMKEDKEAILWETQLTCENEQTKSFVQNPEKWLSSAHDVCHDVFFAMIKGELEEKYS